MDLLWETPPLQKKALTLFCYHNQHYRSPYLILLVCLFLSNKQKDRGKHVALKQTVSTSASRGAKHATGETGEHCDKCPGKKGGVRTRSDTRDSLTNKSITLLNSSLPLLSTVSQTLGSPSQ